MVKSMFKVRSLTYFTGNLKEINALVIKDLIDNCVEVLEEAKSTLLNHGYKVWSLRISFPSLSISNAIKLINYISNYLDTNKYLVSIGSFRGINESLLNALITATEFKVYTSVTVGKNSSISKVSKFMIKILRKLSDLNPINACRFAILFNGPLETPYFPVATSLSRIPKIGISYLYVNLVRSLLKGEFNFNMTQHYLNEPIKILSNSLGIDVFADYSLSPWMDESIVYVANELNYDASLPGFLYFISLLNELIGKLVANSKAQGFNEVMLPYAEDNGLKKLGCLGKISVRDFTLFSNVCVAGVDMVVVPDCPKCLEGLIKDLYAVYKVKGRAVGLRVIPVTSNVGDKVDLGLFGKVCVIPY